ncbi:MAG: helix-turn-helix domain-containing protein, partial [Acutalibacteraceae bacterium]
MESDFKISIGKRIAEIRRSHNVTQEELADHLGVSPKHISHTECGTSSL